MAHFFVFVFVETRNKIWTKKYYLTPGKVFGWNFRWPCQDPSPFSTRSKSSSFFIQLTQEISEGTFWSEEEWIELIWNGLNLRKTFIFTNLECRCCTADAREHSQSLMVAPVVLHGRCRWTLGRPQAPSTTQGLQAKLVQRASSEKAQLFFWELVAVEESDQKRSYLHRLLLGLVHRVFLWKVNTVRNSYHWPG